MKLLRLTVWILLIFGVLTGLARFTMLRWWQIPMDDPKMGASISPTVRPGDWVILWRATPPEFGDLAVCDDPESPGNKLIARIVGESRDELRIPAADIYINGSKIRTETACNIGTFETEDPEDGERVPQRCTIEAMGGGKHMRGELVENHGIQPFEETVDVQKVFLVSDNRLFPWDSRDYGQIDRAACKETIVFRLVSKDGYFDVPNRLSFIH